MAAGQVIRPARTEEAAAISSLALRSKAHWKYSAEQLAVAGFYRALGARLEREIPSSIPGRTIPYFTYALGS